MNWWLQYFPVNYHRVLQSDDLPRLFSNMSFYGNLLTYIIYIYRKVFILMIPQHFHRKHLKQWRNQYKITWRQKWYIYKRRAIYEESANYLWNLGENGWKDDEMIEFTLWPMIKHILPHIRCCIIACEVELLAVPIHWMNKA